MSFAKNGKTKSGLYIDSGDAEENLELFRRFEAKKDEIEASFGEPLSWEESPQRQSRQIAVHGDGDVLNTEAHDAYIDWFFDTNARLRVALEPMVV